MPANLTPQYRKAEEEYRTAQTPQLRIKCLENMLQLIPRHKGTDRLQGDLRTRLKEARAELLAEQSAPRSGRNYRIPRQGAGTIVIVGAPNAGKSRVLKELTSADPLVAEYPFTTREPQAGMMAWEDIQIQLIDTPPITSNFLEPYLVDFIRTADLVVLVIDGSSSESVQSTRDVLNEIELRKTCLSQQTGFDEQDFSVLHVKSLGVLTRTSIADRESESANLMAELSLPFPVLQVELDKPDDVTRLRNQLSCALEIIRVYTRRPGKTARDSSPITLPRGATVEDLARKIHHDLAKTLKFAKVWNPNTNTGRTVRAEHELRNLDLVELHA